MRRPSLGSAALPLLVAVGLLSADPLGAQKPDAPYVPTPDRVVTTMLEMARPTPRDVVYDLGSGDGRLVIQAAKRYGSRGVGVEIQEHLNERARRIARQEGVADRVRFVNRDLFDVDLEPVTVLMLYLGRRINRELRPKILRQMRPGSRVVSHAFDMGDWKADSIVGMRDELALVFRWVVPADAGGRWRLALPSGDSVTFTLDQKYQELRIVDAGDPGGVAVEDAAMRGDGIWFTVDRSRVGDGRRSLDMVGVVQGDMMYGNTATGARWTAERVSGSGRPLHEWASDASGSAGPSSDRTGPDVTGPGRREAGRHEVSRTPVPAGPLRKVYPAVVKLKTIP